MALVKGKRRPPEEGDMDITSMIDCTFLLLIYFLLTSNMATKSAVTLPSAKHGAEAAEADAIIITVSRGAEGQAQVFLANDTDKNHAISGTPEDQEQAIQKYLAEESAKVSRAGNKRSNVIIKASVGIKQREMDRVEKAVAKSTMEIQNLYVGISEKK